MSRTDPYYDLFVKGGAGSGEDQGHLFRGNQYTTGHRNPVPTRAGKYSDYLAKYHSISVAGTWQGKPIRQMPYGYSEPDAAVLVGARQLERNFADPENPPSAYGYQGNTPEEYIQHVEQQLKTELEQNEIFIRLTKDNLGKVVEDGEYYNTFTTKKTNAPLKENKISGKAYREHRRAAEDQLLGVAPDATDRPLYGYLSKTETGRLIEAPHNMSIRGRSPFEDDPYLAGYGDVALKLKPHVKDRSTWTNMDSLDSTSRVRSSTFKEPSYWSMFESYDARAVDYDTDADLYWEAQIYGGVKLEDIAHVYSKQELSPELTATLDSKGIPWTITK